MRKFPTRFIASVVVSLVVFALIIVTFNLTVGWPVSLLSLVIMVGVAWFFAAGLAGKISGNKWSVAIPSLLAIGLIATTLTAGVPWDLTEETVTFKMEASFTYLGSEDNLPIENVAIRFPCPNIDNTAVPTKTFWSLYYLNNDNTLMLEADQDQVYGFLGERTTALLVYLFGVEDSYDGPKIYYNFNRLYPREVFQITTIAYASKKIADKVTLRVYGDNQNRASAHWQTTSLETKINLSFDAKLFKKSGMNYIIVEQFSRSIENVSPIGLWLYPD